jgi:hypothetical protein
MNLCIFTFFCRLSVWWNMTIQLDRKCLIVISLLHYIIIPLEPYTLTASEQGSFENLFPVVKVFPLSGAAIWRPVTGHNSRIIIRLREQTLYMQIFSWRLHDYKKCWHGNDSFCFCGSFVISSFQFIVWKFVRRSTAHSAAGGHMRSASLCIRFEAFMATECSDDFSGSQPCEPGSNSQVIPCSLGWSPMDASLYLIMCFFLFI